MLHFLFSPEPVSAAALIASTILLTRVHMHARGTSIAPILVCFLLPAAGMRRSRLASVLFLHKNQSRFKDLSELLFKTWWSKQGGDLMLGGGARAHGGQDIDTEPNNILACLGKQYVFSWLFPLPAHIFHFTPAEAHLLSSDRRLKHKQMHIPQRKRWKGGRAVR